MSASSHPSGSRKTPSPPSTASSTSSSIGVTRNPPLQPPKPLFFIDHQAAEGAAASDVRRDPFLTPGSSVPGTPREPDEEDITNPFSPPASVVSFSAEQSVPGLAHSHGSVRHAKTGSTYSSEGRLSRVQSSKGSLPSALRHSAAAGPTDELAVHEVPRPDGLRTRINSQVRTSFMSPPTLSRRTTVYESRDGDAGVLARAPAARRQQSTMLTEEIEKPWTREKDVYARLSYILTWSVAFVGIIGGVLRCYFGWRDVPRVGNLCLVMQDDFNTFDLTNTWTREVDMGGFGNGEFEMTTDSSNNSFVKDGKLYIVPTLTADVIGYDNVLNGYTYNISGCTSANSTSCGAVSNSTAGTVINPAMSARISTVNSHSIRYGKVEIVAKLPVGDWLWPALWMLPVSQKYGPWPASGEIDIMEARGNGVSYGAQGINYVRSSLNWGPFTFLNGVAKTYGWWTQRRSTYADGYHTYALEWTDKFIRMYVDTRLDHMLELSFNEPFFERGDFPPTVFNDSQYIATPDPWVNGTRNVAPFDEPFYLIMDVAVGGTNGWFPDGVGNKPWIDASKTAMLDFAQSQHVWAPTWPDDIEQRAFIIDSVKMWQSC